MAEKARKKFQSRIPFLHDPSKKIPNKIVKKFKKLKNLFPALYLAQTGWDRLRKIKKKKKKNLDPNSVPTQPKLENSRKNSKKIQKIKKVNSSIISIQNGLREAEKEWKKF